MLTISVRDLTSSRTGTCGIFHMRTHHIHCRCVNRKAFYLQITKKLHFLTLLRPVVCSNEYFEGF